MDPTSNALDPAPFTSLTKKNFVMWSYDGTSTKSYASINKLAALIASEGFRPEDLRDFDAAREAKIMDNYKPENQNPKLCLLPDDGWIETSVSIRLPPPTRGSHGSEAEACTYNVSGLFYRKPLEVIKAAFREPNARTFHIQPFKEYWQPSPDSAPERIISEVYNSDAFIDEYAKLRSEMTPGSNVEAFIAPILLWSDSTHLATFGNASLWPVYMYLGNQSKYIRGKPSSFSAHHMAYIPKVQFHSSFCDTISDIIYTLLA